MCHLQSGSLISAFDIEALIGFAAVKNTLIASDLFCNEVQSLDELQPKLLALLILCDRDILNVADYAKVVDTTMSY